MPIHSNTKFMVISSNQNLPFIIKNSKNKIAIHFIICWCYKQFTQQYEHNIHCKKYVHLYSIIKSKSKYSRIPCFVEKNLKTTSKIYSLSKHNLWFSINKYLLLLLIFLKTLCLRSSPIFHNSFLLNSLKSRQHDQNNNNSKIQINKISLISPYPRGNVKGVALFIQNHVLILPLNITPFLFWIPSSKSL